MTTLTRWTPFQELAGVQNRVNRLFHEMYGRQSDDVLTHGAWIPPVDIYENSQSELVLRAELPAMTREDIDVTVENNTLTLRGEKKLDREVNEDQYHRVERTYGSFSRSFSLPETVDVTKVAAEYKDGVLTVRLPRREDAKPRQVKVNIAA